MIGERAYVAATRVAPSEGPGPGLTPIEAQVLVRVLCGEQQKGVASDLAIAPSTASHRFLRALKKLGIRHQPVPLPIIVAVQHWSGIAVTPGGQFARYDGETGTSVVLSVPRAVMRKAVALTQAEHEVAGLFIEGLSRSEIARQRGTSTSTVARQIHSIFSALSLFGRYALVRRAAELGCFG